jgi:methionyl-tRNA formyltransferase
LGKALEDIAKVPTILLLTDAACAPLLVPKVEAAGAATRVATNRAEFDRAIADVTPQTRLVSFASEVIVPASVLAALPGPAYNFHPGPPEYPGLFPSVHALYDGRTEFAITLHEMLPQVDSGAIIAVNRFQILPGSDRLALDSATFRLMLEMFGQWAERLAAVDTPLPRQRTSWSGPRRTRADFEALCELGEDPTPEEFARRLRAVGEGPEHALTFTRFGRRFRLVSDAAGAVVRGGVKIG